MSVVLRRRLLALVVLLAAAAAALPLLLEGDDGEPRAPVATTPQERGTTLVAALRSAVASEDDTSRPVRGASAPSRRSAAGGRPAAGSNLGLPAARAAARLFVVGFAGTAPDAPFVADLARRGWGGVVLDAGNVGTPEAVAPLVGALREAALGGGHPAPLVAMRQAGGADSVLEGLPPTPQSRQSSNARASAQARAAAQSLRGLGVGLTLAPDADLASEGGPWQGRSFSESPRATGGRARAAVRAYRAGGIAAAVGHFPGEGAASQDPRLGTASVGLDLDTLRREDVRPFADVARDAEVVAMSEALYVAFDAVTPATMLPEAVALLRGTGFDGAVLSGDLGAAAFAAGVDPGDAAVAALSAGCDLLLLPGDARDQARAVRAVTRAIRDGEVPVERVREALRRGDALRERYAFAPGTAAPADRG